MIRLIVRGLINVLSAAVGLIVADMILPDDKFSLTASGFILTVLIFAIAQAVLSPFIFKVIRRNAEAFLGGIGIVSTLVALIIASLFGNALEISGIGSWFLAAIIIWLVSAIASLFIPAILVKLGIERAREKNS